MNFTLRNIAQIALLYGGAPLIFDFLIVYWLPYILNSLLRVYKYSFKCPCSRNVFKY